MISRDHDIIPRDSKTVSKKRRPGVRPGKTDRVTRLYWCIFMTPRYIRAGQESISPVNTEWQNSRQR
jgi:hypothetical protein